MDIESIAVSAAHRFGLHGRFPAWQAGLLKGKSATTHREDIADLRKMFPDVVVLENRRWVDEGPLITSAGISAGIHMSLHLEIDSQGLSLRATARQMEFDWNEDA